MPSHTQENCKQEAGMTSVGKDVGTVLPTCMCSAGVPGSHKYLKLNLLEQKFWVLVNHLYGC